METKSSKSDIVVYQRRQMGHRVDSEMNLAIKSSFLQDFFSSHSYMSWFTTLYKNYEALSGYAN